MLIACSDIGKWRIEPTYIYSISIPDTVYANRPFLISVDCAFPSSCYEFSHANFHSDANNIYVDIVSKIPVDAPGCFDVMVPYLFNGQYSIAEAGTYIFYFSQRGPTLIDTVIVK